MLALKGNQSTLANEVEEALIDADAKDYAGMESQFLETVELGRIDAFALDFSPHRKMVISYWSVL